MASLGNFTRRASITRFYISSLPIYSPSPPTLLFYTLTSLLSRTLSYSYSLHYPLSGPRVWRCMASQDSYTRRLLPPSSTFLPTHTVILYSHFAFTLRLPSRSSTDRPPYTVLSPTSPSYLYSLHSPGRGCGHGWLLQW